MARIGWIIASALLACLGACERKTEPPLKLDMDFSEALERFVRVKPKDVSDSVERSKTKKPPGDDVPRRPKRKLQPD